MADAVEFEPIVGRYLSVDIGGAAYRINVEEAGQGVPLLCLHTAGADSRQYRTCSTIARSRIVSASSRSTCRITAARRRPTAGG
jgi:hypothetical protein